MNRMLCFFNLCQLRSIPKLTLSLHTPFVDTVLMLYLTEQPAKNNASIDVTLLHPPFTMFSESEIEMEAAI